MEGRKPHKIIQKMQQKKEMNFADKYIKWFSELNKGDIKIAGGKGANLGEIFNNDFPVPPGFVVTSNAFEVFVEGIKEQIKNVILDIDFEDTAELEKKTKEIRELIIGQEMSEELKEEILEAYHILGAEKIDEQRISEDALNILKNSQEPVFVSVRSSATTEDLSDASFAGQHDSFLNVKGNFDLIEHVKRCFASLYNARALYYRNKKGFSEEGALLAVVVQKMVDSDKSGVIFSKDPITLKDNVIIEAVFGLGEGIVSGKIHPDNYIVKAPNDMDLEVSKIKVSEKKIAIVRTSAGSNQIVKLSSDKSKEQVLTKGQVLEIASYAVKLEEHYQKPQDIEFGIEANKVYILQSRPITTLKAGEKQEELSGNILLEGLSASPGIGVGVVKIIEDMNDLSKIKKGDVLVTKMTNPDMVVSMQKSVAIVTDEGGMTAHASIVSREMGIPCIVGTGEATTILKEGMKVTVDGSNGKVYEGEVAETKVVEVKPVVKTKMNLKLIVDLPNFAERAAESKIDSIGLTRIEGMIASMGKHPLEYEKENKLEDYTKILEEGIEEIIKPFKLMWIRSSDIRTDEYGSLKGAPEKEINPMMGLHGIRFSLKHPKIFEAELEAVKNVANKNPDKKLGVMFPQIISIDEIKQTREIFNKYKTKNMQFGVMIETPAAVQIIEDICKESIDFISFGTNDLTQFTLGVDRGEDEVQFIYNEMHPAVLSQIKQVIEVCKKYGVETSICGQAGSKPEMVKNLFKWGIDSISVNADAAQDISKIVKEMEDNVMDTQEIKSYEESLPSLETQKEVKKEKMIEEVRKDVQDIKKKKDPRRVICVECGKETKLPFRPRGDGPFYCRKCFKKKKQGDKGSSIQPFDSKKRIEDKAEEIQQQVEEKKIEQIQENRKVEEAIQTESLPVSEPIENAGDDDVTSIDEGISSEPLNPEGLGVYNPNEESENLPDKRDYNFDKDEDVYSDVF